MYWQRISMSTLTVAALQLLSPIVLLAHFHSAGVSIIVVALRSPVHNLVGTVQTFAKKLERDLGNTEGGMLITVVPLLPIHHRYAHDDLLAGCGPESHF